MKRNVLAGALILALTVSSAAGGPNFTPLISGPVSLAPNGANPTVAFDAKTGTQFVAWIRPGTSSFEVVVSRSGADGQGYSNPVVVSTGDTGIISSVVSPAQIVVSPNGEVYVLYEHLVPSPYFARGRGIPRLVRSTDGGHSFTAPVDVIAAEEVETGAEMANLAIASDGSVVVAWLDYRDAFEHTKLPGVQTPKAWPDRGRTKVDVRLARSTDAPARFGQF